MLNMPFFKQDTGYTCGPTALQMVLAFYGKRFSEAELAKRLHTAPQTGTKHGALITVVTEEGLCAYVNNESSTEELAYIVSSGIPAIIDFTEPSNNESHYAVVLGVTASHITLNDPWNGREYTMPLAQFETRWNDTALHSSRWLLAVSDKPFVLGRQFLPNG